MNALAMFTVSPVLFVVVALGLILGAVIARWGVPWVHRFMVWLVITTNGWDRLTCDIRFIEPIGPDRACERVCPECDWCRELTGHG